jgi:HSP20 family protein
MEGRMTKEAAAKDQTAVQRGGQPGSAQQERPDAGEVRDAAHRESALGQAPTSFASPFVLMGRFMEDIDRLLGSFGSGPALTPRIDVGSRSPAAVETMWVPALEAFERDGQLVIRAEVPGVDKDQITVEIDNGHLVISGERCQESEDRRGGRYRSERVYGSFYRAVPLPEGADPEQAKATFANGVLEITVPMAEQKRSRRLEVQEGSQDSRTKPEQQTTSSPGQQSGASRG